MALMKSTIEWHIRGLDLDDLPAEEEPIIVTLEDPVNESRFVWMDAYVKDPGDGHPPIFCTKAVNEFGVPEETNIWYPVIAWAYPPNPFEYF